MSLASNSPANYRYLTDPAFAVSKSLGGANASASAAMDLVQAVPYPVTEQVIVRFQNSLLSSSFDNLASSITLQHSATNNPTTFVDIPELAALTDTTTTETAMPAASRDVLLPPSVKRYIRVVETATSASAVLANITGSITASLLF